MPTPTIPHTIHITPDDILIDDQPIPWVATRTIEVDTPLHPGELAFLTITIPADQITIAPDITTGTTRPGIPVVINP